MFPVFPFNHLLCTCSHQWLPLMYPLTIFSYVPHFYLSPNSPVYPFTCSPCSHVPKIMFPMFVFPRDTMLLIFTVTWIIHFFLMVLSDFTGHHLCYLDNSKVWEKVMRHQLSFSVQIIQSGERVIWIIYDCPLPKLIQHILNFLCTKPIVSFIAEGQRVSISLQMWKKIALISLSPLKSIAPQH